MKKIKIEVISKTQDNVNFLSEKLDELNSCTTKIKQQKLSFINNTDKNNSKLVKLMKNKYEDDYETFQINKDIFSPKKSTNAFRLKSDSVLKSIKSLKDIGSPNNLNSIISNADTRHSNTVDDLEIQVTRENSNKYSDRGKTLREVIEGSATEHIKGKIKIDTISKLKPIQNHHELGAMHVASEKLRKAVRTDKLKLTNSLKTQMFVCQDAMPDIELQKTKILGS